MLRKSKYLRGLYTRCWGVFVTPGETESIPYMAVYYRISTKHQSFERQEKKVEPYLEYLKESDGYILGKIYHDRESGKDAERPGLQSMIADGRRRRFKLLVVAELDRLGRNVRDLLSIVDQLRERGVNIHFIDKGIRMDGSPTGDLVFNVLAAVAEWERKMIGERIKGGVAAHIDEHGSWGRGKAPKIGKKHRETMAQLAANGVPKSEIASMFGVTRMTVFRHLKHQSKIQNQPKTPSDERGGKSGFKDDLKDGGNNG